MTTGNPTVPRTALFCAHADVDGDETRCPCSVPPGMQIESDWHRANGQVSRILTSQDPLAWIYAVQHVDGTIRAATVVHAYDDRDFTAAQARRLGHALIEAAGELDELLTRAGGMRVKWGTLILASGASVAGNIVHAMLAYPGHALIAATAAVVPPAVLLGATHGVALLVRSRTHGATHWSALAMTVILAGCAFVLSFDALRALALTRAGFSPATAWMWPLAIDLSIAQSTLELLALSGTPRTRGVQSGAAEAAHNDAPVRQNAAPLHDLGASVHPPDWTAAADGLVGAGVTRIDRDKAATVLAELAYGTAPSTVARRHGVGYATVTRIAETTKQQEIRA